METALTVLAWMAVAWVALGIAATVYAFYRIKKETER